MNLYLLTWPEGGGWDTYDSVVVAAPTPEAARLISPMLNDWDDKSGGWASSPDDVEVVYLGTAAPHLAEGIVLASYNAG